eukprot:GHVP01017836.1.p1 GENE.GHVP01017836.1~~GHVP01017836.1.p1  ORF type:complete len:233 (+),score=44.58 GHVP01017836.1:96-701(+)
MEDTEIEKIDPDYKNHARQIVLSLSGKGSEKGSFLQNDLEFSYIVKKKSREELCLMLVSGIGVSKQKGYLFLDELWKLFIRKFENEDTKNIIRSFALRRFDVDVTRLLHEKSIVLIDSNMAQVEKDLEDVSQIVGRSVKDILERGEKIDRMGEISDRLLVDSKKYTKMATSLNWRLTLEQYGPLGVGLIIIILFFYFYFIR